MAQQGVEMTSEELDELFATVDDDGSGEIDFEEFILCVHSRAAFANAPVALRLAPSHTCVTCARRLMESAEDGGEASEAAGDADVADGDGSRKPAARSKGLFAAFKQTVATAAMQNASELTMAETIELLSRRPSSRSEWDLQRLLDRLEKLSYFAKLPARDKSDLRLEVCRRLGVRIVMKGKAIVKEGDLATQFFILINGQASRRDKDGSVELIVQQGRGFGEQALVADDLELRKQMHTVVCDTDETVIGVLEADDYISLVRSQKPVFPLLRQSVIVSTEAHEICVLSDSRL